MNICASSYADCSEYSERLLRVLRRHRFAAQGRNNSPLAFGRESVDGVWRWNRLSAAPRDLEKAFKRSFVGFGALCGFALQILLVRGCNGNQRWYWMQVLGILFMTTTVVAMNSFMDKIGGYLVSSIPAELSTEYVVQQTRKYAQAAKQVRSEFPP